MPRLNNALPKYRKHKQSGQAIVTLNGRDHLLGPYDTKASRTKYDRLIAEWLERGRQSLISDDSGLNIAELCDRYWSWAKSKYVRHGRPTAEQFKIKTALRHLLRLYETHLAADFGPMQLKVVRQSMLDTDWARTYINQQVAVLVRMFKWAATEGLVTPTVYAALDLVDGIRRGESAARETSKVRCVPDATVNATLPHVSPTVQAMIDLQLATGMRPGELCILRPGDIDRSGEIWEYRPTDHKTAHHEHDRLICIGPRGQAILRPFLLRAADAYCFSPKESAAWHLAQRHEDRSLTRRTCGTSSTPTSRRTLRRISAI